MKFKQAERNITRTFSKKIEKNPDLSKTWEAICSIVNVRKKSKSSSCSLKNNGALLFNSLKIAETFNFFFINIGPNGKKNS